MSSPPPYEQKLLQGVEIALHAACPAPGNAARLDILEAVAATVAGFDLGAYRELRSDDEHALDVRASCAAARTIVETLQQCPMHPSLALASLSRPILDEVHRRKAGAYYTDFRLAQYLALSAANALSSRSKVVDPAAGSGILLVATGLQAHRLGRINVDHYIRSSVHAADMDADALRAASLSLSSLTGDISAIEAMLPRLRRLDSLTAGVEAWRDLAPDGFDLVVQNPPWEKLKVSRHEFLVGNGIARHYGSQYAGNVGDMPELAEARRAVRTYVGALETAFGRQGTGEPDLYKLFAELATLLARQDGAHIALVLPAGFIRSQGSQDLRALLLDLAASVEMTIFENRARFFSIDTRFKFLILHAQVRTAGRGAMILRHATGTSDSVRIVGEAAIGRTTLRRLRPDLTVPEVRSTTEWGLFRRLHAAGPALGAKDGPWQPEFCREVDMTRERPHFESGADETCLPLMEGRMIHQYRCAAKAYVSGTGRAAVWRPLPLADCRITPQFTFPVDQLPPAVAKRTHLERVGFCDVTGQTNERSLLASRIPVGVVCGNKVPTITFGVPDEEHIDYLDLWVAIANSFVVDWFLRRIITTSVNYFLLKSVPMPYLDPRTPNGTAIVKLSRLVSAAENGGSGVELNNIAQMRAEIDARVADAYGLTYADMQLVMEDFPLLDRGQPSLPGERASTITRDLVLAACTRFLGDETKAGTLRPRSRVDCALEIGAIGYMPSDYTE